MTATRTEQPAALSTRMRTESAAAHDEAEGSRLAAALVEGRVGRDGIVALTAQLYFVYEALEQAGDALAGDPLAGPFVCPELIRLPRLQADLAALLGPDWRSQIAPTPETAAYAEHLRTVAAASPEAFVAHHYTRYLGDLSGGRILGRRVAEVLGAPDGAGSSFYRFDDIPKPKVFKDDYRARVDATPWTDEQADRLVAEVVEAFRLNTALLRSLEQYAPA